jgi:transposase-like protein
MTETRRRFSDEEKLRILAEADKLKDAGKSQYPVTSREHIHASMLSYWRQQRDKGRLGAPKNGTVEEREQVITVPIVDDSATLEVGKLEETIQELTRALVHAKRRAERAEGLLVLHKEVARLEAEIASEKATR